MKVRRWRRKRKEMSEFKGCSQRQALVNLTETISLPTLTLSQGQFFKLIALIPCPIVPRDIEKMGEETLTAQFLSLRR